MSTNPKANEWKPLVDSFEIGGWDPAFFTDDDGSFICTMAAVTVIRCMALSWTGKHFKPIGTRKEMYLLEPDRYGWQRFGEYMDNTFLDPFIEGAWMTKHNGKYYLAIWCAGNRIQRLCRWRCRGRRTIGSVYTAIRSLSFKAGWFCKRRRAWRYFPGQSK